MLEPGMYFSLSPVLSVISQYKIIQTESSTCVQRDDSVMLLSFDVFEGPQCLKPQV